MGQRQIFISGVLVLTVASVLAGIVPSIDVLITARIFQGLGAVLIAPSSPSIVMSRFLSNKPEMNKAMGIWGAAALAGGTDNVFLRGVIISWLDWPCFS